MYAFLCINPDPAKDGVAIHLSDVASVVAFERLWERMSDKIQDEYNYDLPVFVKESDGETPVVNVKPAQFKRLYIDSVVTMTFAGFIQEINKYIASQE